jgi:hypothetical protein
MPDPTQPPRRFPPPWTVEEITTGQALAYVYFEDETGRVAGLWQKEARDFRPGLVSSAPKIDQRPNQLKR